MVNGVENRNCKGKEVLGEGRSYEGDQEKGGNKNRGEE